MTPDQTKAAFLECILRIYERTGVNDACELGKWAKKSMTWRQGNDGFAHLVFMCEEGVRMVDAGREDKANRWLGFVQGALWMTGFASIDEMRVWNGGQPIPETS